MERFTIHVLGMEQAAWPRAALGPTGAIVISDLHPTLSTEHGCAFAAPASLRIDSDLDITPPPSSTPIPLSEILESPPILDQLPPEVRQRVVVAPRDAGPPLAFFFSVRDQARDGLTTALALDGNMLRFTHDGRHTAADVAGWAGRPITAIARWNPALVSLEVYSDESPDSAAVSFGDSANTKPQRVVSNAAAGQLVAVPQTPDLDGCASWCIGLVFLTREDADGTDLNDMKSLILREGTGLDMSHVPITSLGTQASREPSHSLYFLQVKVDATRFERWREAFGHPSAWAGVFEPIFTRFPLSQAALQTALSTYAYARASALDAASGVAGTLPEFVPTHFVDRRDAFERFMFHACSGHFLVDEISFARRADLLRRVAACQTAARPIVLAATAVADLLEVTGLEWLAAKLKRRTKKAAARVSAIDAAAVDDPSRNLAIDVYATFQRDIIRPFADTSSLTFDLWMTATKLSGDARTIRSLAPNQLEAAAERLRNHGNSSINCEFEVAALADLLRRGHNARFNPIADQQGVRAPDIEIVGLPSVYVECCQKDQHSEALTRGRRQGSSLLEVLASQGRKQERSLLLKVRYAVDPKPCHFEQIAKDLKKSLSAGVTEEGLTVTNTEAEWDFHLCDLGDWRRIRNIEELKSIVPDASFVFATAKQQEGWLTSGLMYQPMVVAISLDTPRRLLASVGLTLKNKASYVSKGGQLPDNAPGIVAISLGDATRELAKEVIVGCAGLAGRFSALSALSLYWCEREIEGYVAKGRRWFAHSIRNPNAARPLPAGFALPDGELGWARIDPPIGP